jgi:DNA-binding NtrC family response regulator
MNKDKDKILLVDDDKAVLQMLHEIFQNEFETILAASGISAIEKFKANRDIAAVVLDIKMPEMDGIAVNRELKKIEADIRIILHTGYPGDYLEDEIDETEKPFDYVPKGDSITRLRRSVRRAVESYRLEKDNKRLTRYAEDHYGLVGKSETMREVFSLIRKMADCSSNVMILGETGTGKELVSRAIHQNSNRSDKKFGILNCNHKSPDLVESDLFGHKKGAFTNAYFDRMGLFESANEGTVFLDDIGDLMFDTQAKLLRVLEDGYFSRIGDDELKHTNVRIICATHRDLEKMVKEGDFREDLYYRLKTIEIRLPPLRDRREDIPLLVERFTDEFTIERGRALKVFDKYAMNALIDYDWPGNVRALKHTVEALIVLTESDIIMVDDVNRYLKISAPADDGKARSFYEQVDEFKYKLCIKALQETDDNFSAASRLLHMDRSNFLKLCDRLGVRKSEKGS